MDSVVLRTMQWRDEGGGLWVATFNRPQVMNALDTHTSLDLRDIFAPLRFDSSGVRCVILTGSGQRAFSAGGDLKERQGMSSDQWRAQHAIIEEGAYAVMNCSVPVIAAVNGIALGGGLEIAMCCDFIYASRSARFGLPEVTRGIIPGAGGTQTLARAIGERKAKEIILSGRQFGSEEAYSWGLINGVCDPDALLPTVLQVARDICANAPIAVRQAKKAIHQGLQLDMTSALEFEVQAYERTIATEDRLEGIAAFNERRKPNFKGR
jgi:enoyl-CoA hydratase/carnithine racemase